MKDQNEHRPRLLLIDDDAVMRRSAGRFLERAGFEVISVPSGPVALRVLSERDVDVAVVDLQMPEMSGVDVLRAFNRVRPELPAGLWSASPFVDELEPADLQLAAFVVPKMRPIAELVEAVRRAVERSSGGSGSGSSGSSGGSPGGGSSADRARRAWGLSTGIRRKDGASEAPGRTSETG